MTLDAATTTPPQGENAAHPQVVQLATYDRLLAEERDRLVAALEEVNTEIRALVTSTADRPEADFSEDGGEGSTLGAERARLEALRDQLDARQEDLGAAFARLATGRFGLCESCGTPIAVERLEAMPETTQCLACKNAPPWRRPLRR